MSELVETVRLLKLEVNPPKFIVLVEIEYNF